MSLSTKIIIAIAAIIAICLGAFIIYKQVENARKLDDIQHSMIEQKELIDNIVRAQSQYASKEDIERYAKQRDINLDVIQKDLNDFNAKIQGINGVTVVSVGQTGTDLPSTTVTPRPDTPVIDSAKDPFGYLSNTQHFELTEQFANTNVPFGNVGFSAWKDKPWEINVSERKYSVTSVLGQDENGRHYTYSKFAIQSGGKVYDIKIDENKFLEEYPAAKFSWFNPRLYMIANGGIGVTQSPIRGEFTPGVAVGLMSYGMTRTNPSLSFLQLGVGYGVVNKSVEFSLSPVQYNIGQHLKPFMNNTFIGPTVQLNPQGNVNVGAGLSVGF